jgi:pre-mRNA-splicing factor ATP-dependent RNA helicase DHX16
MRRARDIKEQLVELCRRVEIDVDDEELSMPSDSDNSNICKAIAAGFFYHAAKLQKSGDYKTLKH